MDTRINRIDIDRSLRLIVVWNEIPLEIDEHD